MLSTRTRARLLRCDQLVQWHAPIVRVVVARLELTVSAVVAKGYVYDEQVRGHAFASLLVGDPHKLPYPYLQPKTSLVVG